MFATDVFDPGLQAFSAHLATRISFARHYLASVIEIDGLIVHRIAGGCAIERQPVHVSLDSIASDPARALDLPPDLARELYARAVIVQSALLPAMLESAAPRAEVIT